MTRPTTDRRDFLKASAAVAGAGYWITGTQTLADEAKSTSANEQIRFACIGVGGKGQSDTRDASREGDIVAVCDIDDRNLEKAATFYKGSKQYNDYRKMFDEMADSIDAVTVSTPDHSHAPASVLAMKLGKHCFCQKPLTHSVYEARLMGEIAKKNNLATQMGNQGTANTGLRRAAELIQAGVLGTVSEVHVWTNRPIWPQGIEAPTEAQEVPPNVHWDLFLGPAEDRPFANIYHPFKWRGWWDFGTGALGDMACHTMNMPFMALDLRDPATLKVEKTSGHNGQTYPASTKIKYHFAANDKRPEVDLYWYDGGERPPQEWLEGESFSNSGCLVLGSEGKLYSPNDYGAAYTLMFKKDDGTIEKVKDVESVPESIPRSPGHFKEFANAIKGGDPAMSNFPGYASALSETVLLGNLAVWSGKEIQWDAKNMKAVGMPELDIIIKPEYREGWTL